MSHSEKIIQTITEIHSALETLNGDYCIIGSASLLLSGFNIGVNDLDILTSKSGALKLKTQWTNFLDSKYKPADSEKFRSDFGRFNFKSMPIEVMGDLEVNQNGSWVRVSAEKIIQITLLGKSINIPTREEQIRIFQLLGRPKDLEKARMLG